MSQARRNKAIARQMVERCINQHDARAMREFTVTPRVIAFQASALASFPDMHVDVLWDVAENDIVVHWARMRGTHVGPWIYAPEPTGRRVEAHALVAFRFNDEGQIVDQWLATHLVQMLEQLGGHVVHRSNGGDGDEEETRARGQRDEEVLERIPAASRVKGSEYAAT